MVRTKRIRRIIILAAIAVAVIIMITSIVRYSRKITGTDWFLMQQEYIEQFASLADQTDDVTALYISEDISEEDFLTHLSVLESQLKLMEAGYERDAENANVRNGTHTVVSKEGSDSIPACFDAFWGLYDSLEATSSDPQAMAYAYLACRQSIISAISDYETSLGILYESATDDTNADENVSEDATRTEEY